VLLLLPVAPAAAHATLVSTDPADGSVVHGVVRTVSATFDESIGVSADSLRVFDPAGHRVDVGGTHPGPGQTTIQVSLTTSQPDGTYTVSWHVVSADSHPVQGAFTFSIGHPSSHVASASVLGHTSTAVSTVYAVDRALGYVGFVTVAGGLIFLAVCWPTGLGHPRTKRWLLAGWILAFVSSAVQVAIQGAFAAGRSLGGVVDPQLIGSTLATHLGTAVLVREAALVLLAVLGLLVAVPTSSDPRDRWRLGGLYLLATGLLAVTWSESGHEGNGSLWGLALVSDALHLVAAAVWLGGLGMLVGLVLFGRAAPPTAERVAAVSRFSPLAAASVGVLSVTGTFQAWRNARSWSALVDTRYGLLVCTKVGLLLLLVLLGWHARVMLGRAPFRWGRRSSEPDLSRLRRGVAVEAALALVVLSVTAVLVQSPTAVESYHPVASASRPFDASTKRGSVEARVNPSRLGSNRVRITVRDAVGSPYRPKQVTASLTQDQEHIGPIGLRLHSTAAGVYESSPVSLDFLGSWTLAVTLRVDAFDETTVTIPVPIT
jgi:copper transport protein